MSYTVEELEDILDEHGEIKVTLDSGMRYEVHPSKFEFNADSGIVSGDGWYEKEEEYVHVEFSASDVEHWYSHDTL